jgi:hypothetical protein
LVRALVSHGHSHLFRSWPRPGIGDDAKRRLLAAAAARLAGEGGELEEARLQVRRVATGSVGVRRGDAVPAGAAAVVAAQRNRQQEAHKCGPAGSPRAAEACRRRGGRARARGMAWLWRAWHRERSVGGGRQQVARPGRQMAPQLLAARPAYETHHLRRVHVGSTLASAVCCLHARQVLQPPVAPRRPLDLNLHDDVRSDEYYWWVLAGWSCATCMCMHVRVCVCVCVHKCGYICLCVCMCVCVCVCLCGFNSRVSVCVWGGGVECIS